ncbi:MAG: multicopper oxidase domain-containing protein [Bauldia sp.]
MPSLISRRSLLRSAATTSAAIAASTLVPGAVRRVLARPLDLTVERRVIEVGGKAASVFGIRGANDQPGLTLDPGERFLANLANDSGEATIVHWHGQTPHYLQDGVAGQGRPLIAAGAVAAYDFAPRPGTHWMHSHHGLQEQLLMAAPLVVRSSEDLAADVQEAVVLLHDFTFRDPQEVLAELTGGGAMGAMGHGGMPMGGMSMGGMSMGGMGNMPGMAMGGMTDLNDVAYDAYLANDRTLDDPLIVNAEPGGRVRLRVINGASSSAFWIDTGGLPGRIIAVDGNPVKPVTGTRFPLAMAQRLDVIFDLPSDGGAFPILATREGGRSRTGIIIATPGATVRKVSETAETEAGPVDLSLEAKLVAERGLEDRPIDVVHRVVLAGSMMPYAWTIGGSSWPDHRPLVVSSGRRVVIEMMNHSMMAHPMHLHGHHFQVIAINGTPLAGAVRDTVLVPAMATVAVAFDANNPGRWLFHCHNLFHMETGMMTEVVYDRLA